MPTPVEPRDGLARHRGDALNGVRILVKRDDVGGSASAATTRAVIASGANQGSATLENVALLNCFARLARTAAPI